MRKLSSLSRFGNLSHCVLFSVDLFFQAYWAAMLFCQFRSSPYVRNQISREPPQTTNIKNREIEADTFAQTFLQKIRES